MGPTAGMMPENPSHHFASSLASEQMQNSIMQGGSIPPFRQHFGVRTDAKQLQATMATTIASRLNRKLFCLDDVA